MDFVRCEVSLKVMLAEDARAFGEETLASHIKMSCCRLGILGATLNADKAWLRRRSRDKLSSQTKVLRKEAVLSVPLVDVWNAWTITEGVVTFFAPKANIQLQVGGPYELYFDLKAPLGFQGTEGCKVLGFELTKSLAFDFIAPPQFPNVRRLRTRVDVGFEEVQRGGIVKVSLVHSGFLEGEEWDESFEFFRWSWDLVLGRLQHHYLAGPIDWRNPYTPLGVRPVPERKIRDRVSTRA